MTTVSAKDFNLEATLDSGQVFGFTKDAHGSFHGALCGEPVSFSKTKDILRVQASPKITHATIENYFDLERDLTPIYKFLKSEPRLVPAYEAFKGLRLIRQDSWQALACFIISSNNNVKRIQGIWNNLTHYFKGFPSASQIARSHTKILLGLGLGYRAPFLFHTAQFVSANPQCLEVIREAEYKEALERVLAFPGIGPKVGDCVLLYGFQKYEAFPVDVWILRIMRKLYFKNRSVSEDQIRRFAAKKWGNHAGYVQQYLFHSARLGVIG